MQLCVYFTANVGMPNVSLSLQRATKGGKKKHSMKLDFDNILNVISRLGYLADPQQVLFLLLLIFLLL